MLQEYNSGSGEFMVDKRIFGCLRESDIDTIEISLRQKMERLISSGDIEEAENVEETIKNLDRVPMCLEQREAIPRLADRTKGFAMTIRDRARNL